MNVVYSSSDSYAEICGVSLTSLLKNNINVDVLDIYSLNKGISDKNKKRLEQTARCYNRNLFFVDYIDLNELTNTNVYVSRWHIGIFFRLYLGTLLSETVKKLRYIYCGVVIRKRLIDFYELDLSECFVAGVDDCRSDLYRDDILLKRGSFYINNGFIFKNHDGLTFYHKRMMDMDVLEYKTMCTESLNLTKKLFDACAYVDF